MRVPLFAHVRMFAILFRTTVFSDILLAAIFLLNTLLEIRPIESKEAEIAYPESIFRDCDLHVLARPRTAAFPCEVSGARSYDRDRDRKSRRTD